MSCDEAPFVRLTGVTLSKHVSALVDTRVAHRLSPVGKKLSATLKRRRVGSLWLFVIQVLNKYDSNKLLLLSKKHCKKSKQLEKLSTFHKSSRHFFPFINFISS